MPYVNVRVAGKLSKDQKKALTTRITDALSDIANKPAAATYITFDEVPRDSWAKGGKLLEE